jgi:hypothetical protein
VELNESSTEIYKYSMKKIEKINASSFLVNAEFDQFDDLDDNWQITIEAFFNAKGEEEFDKPFLKFKPEGVCEFMKTSYKK